MGLCLSQCGEAQHKAAAVAVSISHQSSASPTRPSRAGGGDAQALDASLSLKRFLHLYSEEGRKLQSSSRPSLDDSLAVPHSSELFSLPSEAGGSDCDRGHSLSPSPARGSMARSSTSSRGRKSFAAGRFSADKPTTRTSQAPARRSCSSVGQAEPHKNLVETISRLEKFCDVKLFLENRSSSFRHENSVLLHDSCRELAQKLLCFANEHAHQICHGDGALSQSMRRSEDVKSVAPECAPLEKSVANFLIEVENFVSQQPVEEDERDGGVSRVLSLRFLDADEVQFTDFEATFDSPSPEPATRNPSDGASRPSFDATQEATPSVDSAECGGENSAPVVLRRPGHRHSRTTSDFGRLHHIDGTSKDIEQEKKPRLAFKEISTNVTPPHEQKNHSLKVRTPLELKRGVTRSLDWQDGSIPQLELGVLKREQWGLTQAAALDGQESHRTEAEDSALIEQLTSEEEGGSASPSVAPLDSQPTEGRVSVHVEEEPVCTNRESEDHTELVLNIDSEKSLAMAFDNLIKLLQSPSAELAHNTSELLEALAGANTELSAEENTAPESQVDVNVPLFETESWHDAPASLNTTEQQLEQQNTGLQ